MERVDGQVGRISNTVVIISLLCRGYEDDTENAKAGLSVPLLSRIGNV